MITFVVSDGNVAVGKKWEIMTKEEFDYRRDFQDGCLYGLLTGIYLNI